MSSKKTVYPFPKKWQAKLLSLMIINGSQIVNEKLVKSEYFESPTHSTIAEVVIDMYEKYGVPLTFTAVKEALRKDSERSEFKKAVKELDKLKSKIKPIEEKLILDQVRRFAQHQSVRVSLRSSMELLEEDKIEELSEMWQKALLVGQERGAGEESFYFSSFSERNRRRLEKPEILSTLITNLDMLLSDGGFSRKELNVFLGLPGSGKSFALDWMAKVAIVQKKKVIIYTLEMSADKVATRLDASFSGVAIRELRTSTTKISKKLSKFQRLYGDSLLIKSYPAKTVTIQNIRSHLIEKKMQGFEPEVVIVDYVNLIKRNPETEGSYQGLGDVYIELRSLVQEFNMWGITAAQSNRAGFEAKIIGMKDIGESFEGAMHSDVILTLNQTEDEKQKNHMRIYIAKNRNNLDSKTIPITTNFDKGTFYRRSTGE